MTMMIPTRVGSGVGIGSLRRTSLWPTKKTLPKEKESKLLEETREEIGTSRWNFVVHARQFKMTKGLFDFGK